MRPQSKELCKFVLLFAAWLVILDLALSGVGLWAARSGGRLELLARYLDYGRSVEGKLFKSIGPDGKGQNAIVSAGWLEPAQWQGKVARAKDAQHSLIAVYGQSFAVHVVTEAAKSNPNWQIRIIAAPGAPLSHSYAAFQLDKDQRKAQVVVVGVLASALARSSSMSGIAFSFESPAPYTFPRYTQSASGLQAHWPALKSQAQFRQAFAEQGASWSTFRQELLSMNPAMDWFQFSAWWGDSSSLVRLARRGWVSSRSAEIKAIRGANGLPSELLSEVDVAKAQLLSLKRETLSRGERLVVLLLHDQGYDHALTDAFGGFFSENKIDVIDSSGLINTMNPANFTSDGHFNAASNMKLAEALVTMLR